MRAVHNFLLDCRVSVCTRRLEASRMLKANAAFKTEYKSDDNAYSHLYDMSISFVTLSSGSFQCGQEKKNCFPLGETN